MFKRMLKSCGNKYWITHFNENFHHSNRILDAFLMFNKVLCDILIILKKYFNTL